MGFSESLKGSFYHFERFKEVNLYLPSYLTRSDISFLMLLGFILLFLYQLYLYIFLKWEYLISNHFFPIRFKANLNKIYLLM